jgi:hypothetical protein
MVALIASPASAITTTCATGTASAIPGSQSNYKAQCAIDDTDSATRQVIHDYPFARYHFGSARLVKVTYVSGTGVMTAQTGSTFVTATADTTGDGDNRHSVTASGIDQACLKLPAKTSLKAVGSATSGTLSNTTGSASTAAAGNKPISSISGKHVITGSFSTCDVGRTVTNVGGGATGIPAGAQVKEVLTKLGTACTTTCPVATLCNSTCTADANVGASNTADNALFGKATRWIKVNNTSARNFENATFDQADSTLDSATSGGANFQSSDTGLTIEGTCLTPGTTITYVSATQVSLSSPTICSANARTETSVDTSDSTTLTADAGTFDAGDEGRVVGTVAGCGVPAGAKIVDWVSSSSVILDAATTGGGLTNCTLTLDLFSALQKVGVSPATSATARQLTDLTCDTAPTPDRFTSLSAQFTSTEKLTEITRFTTKLRITKVNSATQVETSPACTVSATVLARVGVATDTSPLNGDIFLQLVTNIQLKNTLVSGAPACGANEPTGTTIAAQWNNPGSYKTGGLYGLPTSAYPTPSIAQIVFPTSVITFAGYIALRPAAHTDEVGNVDPQSGAAHVDIVLPDLPTTIAICPGTDVSTGYTIVGQALGSQQAKDGLGQPGSAIVRGTDPTGGTGTSYISLGTGTTQNGATVTTATTLTGSACTLDATPDLTTDHGFNCLAP